MFTWDFRWAINDIIDHWKKEIFEDGDGVISLINVSSLKIRTSFYNVRKEHTCTSTCINVLRLCLWHILYNKKQQDKFWNLFFSLYINMNDLHGKIW